MGKLIGAAGQRWLQSLRAQHPGDVPDHARPIAWGSLLEQPRRGIPRTVRSIAYPAPALIVTVQNPHRLARCARQMRDRCIDANDQIQSVDQICGICEIVQLIRPVEHNHPCGRPSRLGGWFNLLPRNQRKPGDDGQRSKKLHCDGTRLVHRIGSRLIGSWRTSPGGRARIIQSVGSAACHARHAEPCLQP